MTQILTVEELLDENGIKPPSLAPDRYYLTCPKCSAQRRTADHRKSKVLCVIIEPGGDRVGWNCSHCGWKGPEKGALGKKPNGADDLPFYIYRDASGVIRFRKVRRALPGGDKTFWIQHPNGAGGWAKSAGGVNTKIFLYRADEVAEAIAEGHSIAIVEGEKDCDALWRLGFPATCSSSGAAKLGQAPKWYPEHSAQLRGAEIVVFNDEDSSGYAHADATCKLSLGIAKRVRRLILKEHWPDIPQGGDVSDWLAQGRTREELQSLIDGAPDYAPAETVAPPKEPKPDAELTDAEFDARLTEAATLDETQYLRRRARLAKELGVSAGVLDRLVKMRRASATGGANGGGDGLPGRPITFDDIEPWEEPVDGAELLTSISEAIGEYVIMDAHQRDAAALGVVFAHTHDLRDTAPIFFIVSPTKRCGKTRLERVVKRLVPKPLMASSASPAFLARVIEKHRPTVLIDEFDATVAGDQAMAETLRGQLNSSFDRDGAKIGKCVPLPGGGYEEREFSTWAANWIAGIKKIPETVEDRSVVLRLKRKRPGEKVARFRAKDGGELGVLRRKVARFVADNQRRIREIEPTAPDALDVAGDRAADAWDPLFAIADVAGGAWPRRARNAAVALSGVDAAEASDSVDVELLSDVAQILAACDAYGPTGEQMKNDKTIAVQALERLALGGQTPGLGEEGQTPVEKPRRVVGLGGEQITNALATMVERRWPAWDKGKPMRPHQLARLLRAYGAISQSLRDGDVIFRGYPRDRLDDAIGRYISSTPPNPPDFPRYTVTPLEEPGETEVFENVTTDACNALENAGNASNSGRCDSVTPKKGGIRGNARSRPSPTPKIHSTPDMIITSARGGGVVFVLAPDHSLFTLNWRGPYDRLIDEAIRDNYEAILDWLIREAEGHAPPGQGEPPYTVLGPAPAGERCSLCGDGSPRPSRVKRGGKVNIWHPECADKYVAATMPEDSAGPGAPAASVAFMITQAQKAALRDRGFTDDDIVNLTPAAAHEILAAADPPKMETNDGP